MSCPCSLCSGYCICGIEGHHTDLNNPTIKKLIKNVAAIDTYEKPAEESKTGAVSISIADTSALDEILNELVTDTETDIEAKLAYTKSELIKWKDTEIAKARKEAQLQILRGFRRHDFVRGDFYELAVIDRIQKIA